MLFEKCPIKNKKSIFQTAYKVCTSISGVKFGWTTLYSTMYVKLIGACLEGYVDGVELDLLVQHRNRELKLVECLCDRLELPHGVVDKSTPFGAVVELQPSWSFIVTKVGWGPKP